MKRRTALKTLAALSTTALTGQQAQSTTASPQMDFGECNGVLVDTMLCIGCRKCEWSCNQVNELPVEALETFEDKSVMANPRRPDAGHYTVINEYPSVNPEEKPIWIKVQCMHCNKPACASACLVSALEKTPEGAVTYDASRCMGCRYCMVSCPFQIPAYEYFNAFTPQVRKCTFCAHRTSKGEVPGCVEICPVEALTFGKRSDLLALARKRIAESPERYQNTIYGEHEVGGTSWLYLTSKPVNELGLPELQEEAPPDLTEGIQHGVFKKFIAPIALFAFLGEIMWLNHKENNRSEREGHHES